MRHGAEDGLSHERLIGSGERGLERFLPLFVHELPAKSFRVLIN